MILFGFRNVQGSRSNWKFSHEDIIVQLFDNGCTTEHTDAKLLYLTNMCFQALSALLSGCVTSASGFRNPMVVK